MSFSGTKGYITKPKPGVQINPLHPLSQGLVGYWLFNEGAGSLANDISGYGNHGTLKNMSPNVQGSGWGGSKHGGGLGFDGSNDYGDCGNDKSLLLTTKATFSFWINPKSVAGNHNGVIGRTNNPDYNYIVRISAGFLQFRAWAGTAQTIQSNTAIVELNNWQYFTIVVDLPNIYFYKNGILIKSATPAFTSLDNGVATDTNIGVYQYSTPVYFNGSIDLVSIHKQALSPAEVKQLYHNPFCNLLQVPIRRYSVAAPPVGAIMNLFQTVNLGADLYQGAIVA